MQNLPLAPLALILILAGCDGNPLGNVPVTDVPVVPPPSQGSDGGISRDGLPPGTTNPSAGAGVERFEARGTGADQGNGFVTAVQYDAATDTFQVNNLAFDGGGTFTRGTAVGQLGSYAVYESAVFVNDSVTDVPIEQLAHRAIYGVSPSGDTEFAIVRTGSFVPYGFGGFLYQRNGTVTLPTTGQANYTGDYAALRDFDGQGGLEYARGDMQMAIDFGGFGGSGAVQGEIRNRRIFGLDGSDITSEVLTAMSVNTGVTLPGLPTLVFNVGPGVIDVNGEILGELGSSLRKSDGTLETFETGNYYAIVSGAGANEVVGVVVVTADDPRATGVTVRETGGFILARP